MIQDLTVAGSDSEVITATIGITKSLECKADGWPSPTYQWRYEGHTISNQEIFSMKNVSIETAGVYECLITNGFITRVIHKIVNVPCKIYTSHIPLSIDLA